MVDEAITQVKAMLHGIHTAGSTTVQLGPIPTAKVDLERAPVRALLDTRSPVSIVSLDFFLRASAANQPEQQSLEDWEKEVRARLEPPTVSLHSYGGDELAIVWQVKSSISRGGYSCDDNSASAEGCSSGPATRNKSSAMAWVCSCAEE